MLVVGIFLAVVLPCIVGLGAYISPIAWLAIVVELALMGLVIAFKL